jgi:hypothetical protein
MIYVPPDLDDVSIFQHLVPWCHEYREYRVLILRSSDSGIQADLGYYTSKLAIGLVFRSRERRRRSIDHVDWPRESALPT